MEFENIQMNFEEDTRTIEHDIDKYKEAISILKPFYEIVSIFTAKSTIDTLKLIQTLQKFTVKGNTNKRYFDLWIKSLPDGTIKSKISGRSSIGQIVQEFSETKSLSPIDPNYHVELFMAQQCLPDVFHSHVINVRLYTEATTIDL